MIKTLGEVRWRRVIHRVMQNPFVNNGQPYTDTFIPVNVDGVDFENIDLGVATDVACQCCGETKPTLSIDVSGGEYSSAHICADCVKDFIESGHQSLVNGGLFIKKGAL